MAMCSALRPSRLALDGQPTLDLKTLTLTLTITALAILVWWTRIRTSRALADDYGAWRDCYLDRLEWEHDAMARGRAYAIRHAAS